MVKTALSGAVEGGARLGQVVGEIETSPDPSTRGVQTQPVKGLREREREHKDANVIFGERMYKDIHQKKAQKLIKNF